MKSRFFQTTLFVVPASVFMLLVFAGPLLGVAVQSVSNPETGAWSLAGFREIFTSSLFYRITSSTLAISLWSTFISLLLAYPLAYYLSGLPPRRRAMLLILVLIPFWTSILVKSFAFTILLGSSGILNSALAAVGLPPLQMLFNRVGVIVGMSHFLIPFMVFPILASLTTRPAELASAARIMGAGDLRIFWQIVLPLSLPGVLAGTLMVFILSLGFFVVPVLLGGRQDMMLANLVDFYIRETLNTQMASVVSLFLMVFAVMAAIGLSRVPGGSNLLGGAEK